MMSQINFDIHWQVRGASALALTEDGEAGLRPSELPLDYYALRLFNALWPVPGNLRL
jgi:hypothetical protein